MSQDKGHDWYCQIFVLGLRDGVFNLVRASLVKSDVASHSEVLRGSSRVPVRRARDEPLRTSAWKAKSDVVIVKSS